MKRFLLPLLALTMVVTAVFGAQAASAAALGGSAVPIVASAKSDVCSGVGLTGGNCGDKGAGVTKVITAAINILSVIVGVVAVIMIIIGGLKYVTSAGDASGIASAKNTVIYAIVGLVIVAMAQAIVYFVLNKL